MKNKFLQYLTILSLSASAPMVHGIALSTDATINWGDAVFSTLIDSTGLSSANLDSSYHFQLGAFEAVGEVAFTPDGDNLVDWDTNWKIFDEADFNPDHGYFTAGYESGSIMSGDAETLGTSLSQDATAGFDFSNHNAYIWIFNGKSLTESTEWFLGRISTWIFPNAADFVECCGPDYDLQWSLSSDDTLDGAVVDIVFGGYKDTNTEAGSYDDAEVPFLIQTHSVVPEFSTLAQTVAMISTSLLYLVGRRKKGQYS